MDTRADRERFVVVCAVDDSAAAADVVKTAAYQALRSDGELHLIHCLQKPLGENTTEALEAGRRLLEGLSKQENVTESVTLHLAAGVPWIEIVQLAANVHADLVVVGIHDQSA